MNAARAPRAEPLPPPATIRITPGRALLGSVDEEARIASIPPTRLTKGIYFRTLLEKLPRERAARVWPTLLRPPRQQLYQPFLDYPFADAMRWLHAAAHAKHPSVSLLEGLRRLGRESVQVYRDTPAGQVMTSVPRSLREVLTSLPALYDVTNPGSHLRVMLHPTTIGRASTPPASRRGSTAASWATWRRS